MVGTSEAFQQMSADIAGLALNTKRAGSATLRDRPGPARGGDSCRTFLYPLFNSLALV
jgi:hypothetical protein